MNAAAGTRTLDRIIAARRFDPKAVLLGVVILVLLNIVVSGFFYLSSKQADALATPVVAVCKEGGAAAMQLNSRGACRAAGDVSTGVGPYKSETEVVAGEPGETGAEGAPGDQGIAGAPGANATGVPGVPGTNATGVPGAPGLNATGEPGKPGDPGADATGEPGEPGQSPPCLSEPTQCRGPEGQPGQNASLPASYTKTYPGGVVESCSRNGGSEANPTWFCTTTTPEPEPTPTDDPILPEPSS